MTAPLSGPEERQAKASIYVASKTRFGAMWREQRAAGANIIATWIDESGPGQTKSWSDLWCRCISEAGRADITLVYREPGDVLRGALVEVGVALASGKLVFVVGDMDGYSWTAHPNVTGYASLEEALDTASLLRTPGPRPERDKALPEDVVRRAKELAEWTLTAQGYPLTRAAESMSDREIIVAALMAFAARQPSFGPSGVRFTVEDAEAFFAKLRHDGLMDDPIGHDPDYHQTVADWWTARGTTTGEDGR